MGPDAKLFLMSDTALPSLTEVASRVKSASYVLTEVNGEQRTEALRAMARCLERSKTEILKANISDLERGRRSDLTKTQMDRLTLNDQRFEAMVAGVLEVAQLPEVVGQVVKGYTLPNGLSVQQMRVPLGVVGIVYENRPNVTADAAALCVKSANAVMLRGSSQAIETNLAIGDAIVQGLEDAGLPGEVVTVVRDTTRDGAIEFMRLNGYIDCLIPRGGPALIRAIRESATVPYVLDGDGNCHIYVDKGCDIEMAKKIVANAKVQRPGVCNAAETLLVHEAVAREFLSDVPSFLRGVEIRGDDETRRYVLDAMVATEDDFATEFLDMVLAVRVVKDLDEAIAHIRRFSTGHSEAIVTNDRQAAERFKREVDAAAVVVNASTRFVDGNQLGLGAEIGISTQKLHARGPMGLEALTNVKYVIEGNGHIRT
jgi:glutamate-5-semialdehyde dehydrogenase